MHKDLFFLFVAGLLATPGCKTPSGGTSGTDSTGQDTTQGEMSTATAGDSVAATDPTSTSFFVDMPSEDLTSSGTTMLLTSGPATDGPGSATLGETGGELYGNCGWNEFSYGCAADGAQPGVESPEGWPIACPEEIPDNCDTMLPSVGCCTPSGVYVWCAVDEGDDIHTKYKDCG